MKDMPRTSPTRTGPARTGPVRAAPQHAGPAGPAHPGSAPAAGAVPVVRELPSGPPGILVGLDGSDGSLWALDRAFTEAVAHDLPLYVIAAVDPAPAGYPPGMADLTEDSVDRLLESMGQVALRALDAVRTNHPPMPAVTVHVILGDAVETLLKASAGHPTLVVGARGNGGFDRLLLGSVATAVIHHSACPVLLVPGGTVDSDPPGSDPPYPHETHRRQGPGEATPPVGAEEYEPDAPGSDT